MRRWRVHVVARWPACVAAGAVLAAAGCDRMPWSSSSSSSSESKPAQAAAAPAAPSAQLPAAPHASPAPFVSEQDVVARVNGTAVSTSDVELAVGELKRLVEAYQGRWETLPAEETDHLDLVDVANSVVDSELKAQEVRSRGLNTEAKRRWAYVQRSFYAQEWDRWQRDRATPTEAEIHTFYEQNKAGFIEPERIHVRQIVTESLSEAEAVRTKAIQGADVAQLARDFSVGAGREQGGDVGWYVREVHKRLLTATGKAKDEKTFFEQLEPVAFALEVGQSSMPVKGPDGKYYVIKLEERKATAQQTELDVRDTIKEGLALQKLQAQLKQLRDNAKIEKFWDHLRDVKQ